MDADVIVVGAGPTGSTAAREIAAGIRGTRMARRVAHESARSGRMVGAQALESGWR